MHVENGWQSGKEMKNVEGTSTKSLKWRYLRQDRFILILKHKKGRRIEEWYVLVQAREAAERGVIETPVRLICLSLQKGKYELETTEYKFDNYSKLVESTDCSYFYILY